MFQPAPDIAAVATDAPEIQVRGLRRSFGATCAVAGLDLEVRRGELFAFLGPNGAGKTTSINMLTGLLTPDAGSIKYRGIPFAPRRRDLKALIGVVPQHNNLDKELTATENLRVHGRLFGLRGAELERRIEAALAFADLGAKRDTQVSRLSGGMKRKLVIVRALLHRPAILFLDEPTVGLDPHSRRRMWAFLRRINQEQGCTIFLTTHYIEEAESLAGRVMIIDQGKVIAEGSPERLKARAGEHVLEIYRGEEVENEFFPDRPAALRRLEQLQESVRIRETTLEDVFLQLTGKRMEG